jgi:hypothetical protein
MPACGGSREARPGLSPGVRSPGQAPRRSAERRAVPAGTASASADGLRRLRKPVCGDADSGRHAPFGASSPLLVRVILSEPDATFWGSYVVARISPFVTATRVHRIARTMELVIPGRLGVHSRASQQVARMSEAKSGVGLAANPGFALRRDRAGKAAMTTNVHAIGL